MRLAVVSTVRGYSWAGSEELWLGAALEALREGAGVTASLHADLHAGEPLESFREKGGELRKWRTFPIARLARIQERLQPNFTYKGLGNPDHALISTGSLPSLLNVPGLLPFLTKERVPFTLLVQFNADCLPVSPAERRLVGKVLQSAANLVFVSRHNLHLAERQFNLNLAEKATVIYNPIRTIADTPVQLRKAEGIRLACVARFETLWKAQDLLVEIMSNPPWRQRPVLLRFYGEGPDKGHVEALAERLRNDRVEFPGYVRDLGTLWSDNDAMVLPSRGEGTPLAALEAMMCGRPVITTDVGGNGEVIEDGVHGYLADAATPRSFAATLERAWNDRDRWPEIGAAAHRRAHEIAAAQPLQQLWQLLQTASPTKD